MERRNRRTLGDLVELDLLEKINEAMKSCPESMNIDQLVYDRHHTLLAAAYLVRGFINNIHFQEKITQEDAEFYLFDIILWTKLMEENKNPEHVKDFYMKEKLDETPFEGSKDAKFYKFITYYEGNPYVPHWFALPLAKKALSVLKVRLGEEDTSDV